MTTSTPSSLSEPIVAGVVTALVGFTSSFAVVVAGLRAVGADPVEAASGLLALTVTFGIGTALLCVVYRRPITLAWSTPGAAMLASMGASYHGGWSAAVGAFVVVGLLIVATGLVPALGELIGRIPTPIAQAMLAGVLLTLCLAPMKSLVLEPVLTIPILLVWLAATRCAPRWALPLTLATALVVITVYLLIHGYDDAGQTSWWPQLAWTTPSFDLSAIVGIAVPLYIVTMASQNVPGVAVLKSFGYETPWRAAMLVTGATTLVSAPFGGHANNLAALSAALAAGEEAGADRSRRWIAGVSGGISYLVLAVLSGTLVTIATIAPAGLLEAVAGLALLMTFANALLGALGHVEYRIPAALTFVTAAAGVTFGGIGAAFWALVVGLIAHFGLRRS
ncbi:benzoate/H(+) symporter BenE family transporter [Gordonia sp. ABSL49_1]|uniref:benzoate/H(+) symporter BenE family transporter n=1 Tax=unclassified Gordonia (in: high G+C Gram-positive bacteria) TaxID=2657482 RepID=UPI001F0E8953|nr:benzoate/H(+) symporter BenE family transporter [Gordonia sp. ABSL49_1]MCH5643997.1 benzoate/H(+) symporter BenE family transporter [Gordonia sp. ABSL49_1]